MAVIPFPAKCGHLKIFASYSRTDYQIAKQITARLALNNAQVFFDETSIDEIDFDGQIRREILECDVFVVLIGRDFIDNPNSFARAEYQLACEVFATKPHRIVPVVVDEGIAIEELDDFLRAKQIIFGAGDLALRLNAVIDKIRPIKFVCWLITALVVVGAMAWIAWLVLPPLPPVNLEIPDTVELRPLNEPRTDLGKDSMLHTDWLEGAPMFYSFNLALQHLSDRGPRARLLDAIVEFKVTNRSVRFDWLYFGCVANGCEGAENWLGQKGPPTGETTTILPGELFSEEVIYREEPFGSVSYQELVDLLLESSSASIDIRISATVSYSIAFIEVEREFTQICRVDLDTWRVELKEWMLEKERYPWWTQFGCEGAT